MHFTLAPIEAEYEQWLVMSLECERRQLREQPAPRDGTAAMNVLVREETPTEGEPA